MMMLLQLTKNIKNNMMFKLSRLLKRWTLIAQKLNTKAITKFLNKMMETKIRVLCFRIDTL